MSKSLVVVESPSKAKTINKYLGSDFSVVASVGHIKDLPKSNKDAIDIEGGFVPKYVITPGKEETVGKLKQLAKKCDDIYLATDPDREGEAIAWHIAEEIGGRGKNLKRIAFHEITKKAVDEAMRHPREIDKHLVKAQEARRVLDRLVGYDLSGLIWKKLRYGLSAGRVQSPALRILVEREREIRAFIREPYWVITAEVETPRSEKFALSCSENARSEDDANRIVKEGANSEWKVTSVSSESAKRSPRAPFTTSTLQQGSSSRLGYSPSITMRLAQKLYEAGKITYMRTDSTNLSTDAVNEIEKIVKSKYGTEYSSPRQYKTKSKNAQEAHEAIRPTDFVEESAGNSPQEQKLYKLIWQRAVSSQMADAQLLRTKISAKPVGVPCPDFTATGTQVIFKGWLMADKTATNEETILPEVEENEALKLLSLESELKETEPPKRYSEAGLIKELEKRGIGRPSTYASTIQTLLGRNYVEKAERSLKPTDTGEAVSSFLENHFGNIISDNFTAEMEESLDEISRGEKEYEKTLSDFYKPFSKQVKEKEGVPKISDLGPAPKEFRCPDCEGDMVFKLGKNGKFLSCAKFPECSGARTLAGEKLEKIEPKPTGEKCPKCKEGDLVERAGKFGSFIACNKFPKCRFIKNDEKAEKAADTGVPCPECEKEKREKNTLVARRGRFGIFYCCSSYPKCKFAIKAKPTGDKCEKCNSLMMEGTKTIPVRCSNKQCPNHTPQKKQPTKKEEGIPNST